MPVCALSKEVGEKIKDPIVVTSKMLKIDSEHNTAVFEDSVVAETPEMTLYAEKMVVFYNKTTGHVTRVNALGGVTLVEKESVVTADEATYYVLDERVVFKGDLKVIDRKDFLSGERKMSTSGRDKTGAEISTRDLKR